MLLIVLAPVKPIMLAVGVLICVDLITGLWASLKRKRKITSRGLRRTIGKMLAYQLAIITAFVMETWLLPDVPMVKVVSGLIGVTETKSVFENLSFITGVDFIQLVLGKLQQPEHKDLPHDPAEVKTRET
jgi:hypothetical protein